MNNEEIKIDWNSTCCDVIRPYCPNGALVWSKLRSVHYMVRIVQQILVTVPQQNSLPFANIGKMYCPECSHFINENEIKDDKCPICKRVTLMRMWRKEDE